MHCRPTVMKCKYQLHMTVPFKKKLVLSVEEDVKKC